MISFDAIQAILFDKDGTLIDYHKSWEPTNRRAAALASGGDAELALRLLERGGTDEPMTLYRKFRGAEPDIKPLLRRRGLTKDA